MTPGPLITVGPLSKIEGDVSIIDPGVITIELAPHKSVIVASAVTVSVAATVTVWLAPTVNESFVATVTLRLMSTVKESFIITVADLLFWIVSVWLLPTLRVSSFSMTESRSF